MITGCNDSQETRLTPAEVDRAPIAIKVTGNIADKYVTDQNLSPEQRATATQMVDIVFAHAVVSRLSEKCPKFVIDQPKMDADGDVVTADAKKNFSTREVFMQAVSFDKQEEMGEDMRRFFSESGVEWEADEQSYCALAQSLIDSQLPMREYLKVRD